MKNRLLTVLSGLLLMLSVNAQYSIHYQTLDVSDPIQFFGSYIIYNGERIELGPKALFIDGQLSDEEAAQFPYVFNSVQDACLNLSDGNEAEPMILYIAPYVYWIENPDDPLVRKGVDGKVPYGMEIDCEWLRFYGLTKKPENVVLACNRGQTIGAEGNFTMFRISGEGTSSENITFGNYCNVDLEFPLKPSLNKKKRADAIVQAQLIHCDGDKVVARNTRFISRLNLCNFVGAKRAFFDQCHLECTDDALCGTGVYLNCTFNFFSSKPFYTTIGTGAVFLNCDINIHTSGEQYFTKAKGQMAVVDCRFVSESATDIEWMKVTPSELRNYTYNNSLNGVPIFIGSKDSVSTVDMEGKKVLNAYRLIDDGDALYNVYNLLKGDDDWDPTNTKNRVEQAAQIDEIKYVDCPVTLKLDPWQSVLETGKDTFIVEARAYRFGDYAAELPLLQWKVIEGDDTQVNLIELDAGKKCKVIPTNTGIDTENIQVQATTPDGLEAACLLTVLPQKTDAPNFTIAPKLSKIQNSILSVDYQLDTNLEDQSLVSWYRCADNKGTDSIEVAVSRLDKPYKDYKLSTGDVGYYIMAVVQSKDQVSVAGEPFEIITRKAIKAKDVKGNSIETNFINTSLKNQLKPLPGFWMFSPIETTHHEQIIQPNYDVDAWYYGEGREGSANKVGLLQTGRSAQLIYTSIGKSFGDMTVSMTVSPFKTAGQGFSMAHMYMDVLIKFDTQTMSGYALRFIRTTKYGNAVDCYFVEYKNGEVKQISPEITTSCFRSPCSIEVSVVRNRLHAKVSTLGTDHIYEDHPEVLPSVDIETTIQPSSLGGFGIQYNGGSTTMIEHLKVEWKE